MNKRMEIADRIWGKSLLAAALLLPIYSVAQAQELYTPEEETAEEAGARGFKLGPGARLITSVEADTRYSDNFYSVNDALPSTSTMTYRLRPEGYIDLSGGSWGSILGASVDGGITNHNHKDNYADATGYTAWHWQALTAHQFNARASAAFGHDAFGTTRTEGIAATSNTDLDKWRRYTGDVGYIFGAKDDRFKSDIDLGAESKRYYTNTVATTPLDYKLYSAKVSGYYSISDRTQLVARLLGSKVDFDNAASAAARDAKEYRARAGMRWAVTGQTTGEVLGGYVHRTLDTGGNRFSAVDWAAKVMWSPVVSTRIGFETGRESSESYVTGVSFIDSRYGLVNWAQVLAGHLSSNLSYRYENSAYVGSTRVDRNQLIGAGLQYAFQRNWSLLANYEHPLRSSTTSGLDYKANIAQIGVRFAQ